MGTPTEMVKSMGMGMANIVRNVYIRLGRMGNIWNCYLSNCVNDQPIVKEMMMIISKI